MTDGPTRRRYLLTAALAGVAGVAGCSDSDTDAEQTDGDTEAAPTDETPTLSPSTTLTPTPVGSTDDYTDNGAQADVTTRAENSQFAADDVVSGDKFGKTLALSSDGSTVIVGATETDSATGSAYVFAREDEGWTQQTRLDPGDVDDGTEFGADSSLSGDGTTALVGTDTFGAESAHVFSRDEGPWRESAVLRPSSYLDSSGVALSSDGETALVGIPSRHPTGEVHEFTRSDGA